MGSSHWPNSAPRRRRRFWRSPVAAAPRGHGSRSRFPSRRLRRWSKSRLLRPSRQLPRCRCFLLSRRCFPRWSRCHCPSLLPRWHPHSPLHLHLRRSPLRWLPRLLRPLRHLPRHLLQHSHRRRSRRHRRPPRHLRRPHRHPHQHQHLHLQRRHRRLLRLPQLQLSWHTQRKEIAGATEPGVLSCTGTNAANARRARGQTSGRLNVGKRSCPQGQAARELTVRASARKRTVET